jgi:DNA-binding CsgD family transcriptional regulator
VSCGLPFEGAGESGGVFACAARAAAQRYGLTTRERQVLALLLAGRDRRDMARALGLRVSTVKWHLHNVYAKLEVETAEATLRRALFLDDARWLDEPLRSRAGLERLLAAADQVLEVRAHDGGQGVDEALTQLERELELVRREAAVGRPPRPMQQIALPLGEP